MILAAGRGGRLGDMAKETPKALLTVGDKKIIEYQLAALAKAGITNVVMNTHHLADQLQDYLGDGSQYGVNIQYSYEPDLLGTGGGIKQALPLLGDEAFILLSADVWTDYPLEKLYLAEHKLAHLVLMDNPNYHPNGDFAITDEGLLNQDDEPKQTYASIGVMHPDLFKDIDETNFGFIGPVLTAMKKGLVTGAYFDGHVYNTNTQEELQALRDFITERETIGVQS
tara:strand:- start:47282 stop:47959 length:678 start_codon:yes stop_codon:yes gene_type:complete